MVILQDHVSAYLQDYVSTMQIKEQADGTTMLLGPVQDQSALHGLLALCVRFNFTIVAVMKLSCQLPSAVQEDS